VAGTWTGTLELRLAGRAVALQSIQDAAPRLASHVVLEVGAPDVLDGRRARALRAELRVGELCLLALRGADSNAATATASAARGERIGSTSAA
jgi:hypothetical protein